ncbi:ribonuclease H-like domain-containing protein [Chytriomyces sp. MP71]|nr:ribonuclease H-like domain-containing protein [Chytriomyces sp. MP71]
MSSKKAYYAVRKGYQAGMYSSWSACAAMVHHFPKAEFKKFDSITAAAAFLREGGAHSEAAVAAMVAAFNANGSAAGTCPPRASTSASGGLRATMGTGARDRVPVKKRGRESTSATLSTAWSSSTSGLTKRVKLDQSMGILGCSVPSDGGASSDSTRPTDIIDIYTDGACSGNGFNGARGGIGVFFGPNDPRNISEPLPGDVQTNNRAEILAAVRALQAAPANSIRLYTDSMYVCNGITSWIKNWKKNNWRTSAGKDVLNKDLWQDLDEVLAIRKREGKGDVVFTYIKAHAGQYGNEQADCLAVQGANKFNN